tara:strand:- start:19 stop:714 length:696 start_codon:yes stop_codon:yes gene_type:complete
MVTDKETKTEKTELTAEQKLAERNTRNDTKIKGYNTQVTAINLVAETLEALYPAVEGEPKNSPNNRLIRRIDQLGDNILDFQDAFALDSTYVNIVSLRNAYDTIDLGVQKLIASNVNQLDPFIARTRNQVILTQADIDNAAADTAYATAYVQALVKAKIDISQMGSRGYNTTETVEVTVNGNVEQHNPSNIYDQAKLIISVAGQRALSRQTQKVKPAVVEAPATEGVEQKA